MAVAAVERYKAKICNWHQTQGAPKRILGAKFNNYKHKTYLSEFVKSKKGIPDCTKYSKLEKWGKDAKFAIPKGAKLRWLWHILHEQKSKPAPNAYPERPKERVRGRR